MIAKLFDELQNNDLNDEKRIEKLSELLAI